MGKIEDFFQVRLKINLLFEIQTHLQRDFAILYLKIILFFYSWKNWDNLGHHFSSNLIMIPKSGFDVKNWKLAKLGMKRNLN